MSRVPLDRIDPAVWSADLPPLDAERVAGYADEAKPHGAFAAPVHLVPSGARYLVVDGRHRVEAARALGWDALDAVVHHPGSEADVLALAVHLHGDDMPAESAKRLVARLEAAVAAGDRAAAGPTPLDPRRRRLLHSLLTFLHETKRVQDARLAQLFDLGDAAAAQRLRVDARGLAAVEPMGLHEMPAAVVLGIRELIAEGLLAREEVADLFPLNERERLHLKAERALRILAGQGDERVKLKGSRWGPDYRSNAPSDVRVVARLPGGREVEVPLAEIPGLDKHTIGIIRKAFLAREEAAK